MLSYHELRRTRADWTCCPVVGCNSGTPLQAEKRTRGLEMACPDHGIAYGRSTFEYLNASHNLLRESDADMRLLSAIRRVKRESRMARERSEDALTWNVFRHLEATGHLQAWLATLTHEEVADAQVHYWSFDASTAGVWAPLAQAREAFGERPDRGSEPDLVITTAVADVWVEAKFGSTNDTRPTDVDGARGRYSGAKVAHYLDAVKTPFDEIAVSSRRYELLRLWLLGSWAAARRGKRFLLVNLVRHGLEEDVEAFAARHFRMSPSRSCTRSTWEGIYRLVSESPRRTEVDADFMKYMAARTLGYDRRGRLVKAFAL